jgi:hypothetical protein
MISASFDYTHRKAQFDKVKDELITQSLVGVVGLKESHLLRTDM